MSVTYSKLCDTSLEAYLAYLVAVRGNGTSVYADGGVLVGDDGGHPGGDSVGGDGVEDRLSGSWSDRGLFLTFVRAVGARVAVVGETGAVEASQGQASVPIASGLVRVSGSEPLGSETEVVKGSLSDEPTKGVVGKWNKKNRATRERRRIKARLTDLSEKSEAEVVDKSVSVNALESEVVEKTLGHAEGNSVGVSYFSACSDAVRQELRETRALRYIAENKLSAARAMAMENNLQLERKSRLDESKFELQRQRVEVQLNNLREKRLGGVTTGWVESVIGSLDETGTSTPSLSVGSISPSSSMSVEQEKKLRGALDQMATRVKELEAKLTALSAIKLSAADKEIAAYTSCYEKGDFSLQGATSDSIDLRYDGFGYD